MQKTIGKLVANFGRGGGKTLSYALAALSLAVALGAATTAEARSITGVERIVSSGEMSLNVTFEAGESGDKHALYIAYDTEDKGGDISSWAALQRGCNVADDATFATIPVSPLLIDAGYTVCRVFLTTSAAPYDTQLEYLRQSGTQYIDTGIRPDVTCVAVMDTKLDSNATRQQRFFGVASDTYKSGSKTYDDNSAEFSFDCYINGDGKFASACKDGKGDWKAAGAFTTDRVRISLSAVEHHHVTITNLVTGAAIANATYNTTCTKTSITNLLVFAQHFVQQSAVSIGKIAQGANLYSFSITTNSVAACDYKPCKLGDRVGVYDSVTDTIIYSASGTDFDAANSGSPVACSLLAGENQLSAAPSATGLFLDYTWRGTATNWGDADAWTKDGDPATWVEGNNAIFANAIFATANATATLAADATANSIAFSADATVGGTGGLTVKFVSVDSGVSATISAPTAGALTKTGTGTLTLGSSRAAQTTVSEGTLTLSGSGTTLDWSKLALGTDAAKPVTLRFENGATLSSMSEEYNFGNRRGDITAVIEKADGDWTRTAITRIGRIAGGKTTFVNVSGDLTFSSYLSVGALTESEASSGAAATGELAIAGGTVSISHVSDSGAPYISVGSYGNGIVTVTNNAAFNVTASMALSIHPGSGTLNVSDGGTATVGTELVFGWSNSDAGTGTVNLGTGGTLVTKTMRCASYGTGVVNFDGGTLKATNTTTTLIQASDRLTVNVGANGGTIDNDGNNITIAQGLSGTGTIALTGSGTTTFAAGVGAEGGVSVANGTTLALDGATPSSFGALTLAAGSTLDIATPVSDSAAFAATTLNLPAEGTVALTSGGGAFVEGLYAICEMSGVTAADGAKFAPSAGTLAVSWSVDGDILMLTVGTVDPNTWTGSAGDRNLSNPANWYGLAVPTSGTATINTSGDLIVGGVFSPDVIVFPATCQNVTISGENAITGISAITNLSTSTCTFEVPVAFADEICVSQGAYYYYGSGDNPALSDGGKLRFAGGVTGSSFAEGTSRRLDGVFTIPASANWTASTTAGELWTVTSGSSLTLTGYPSEQQVNNFSCLNNNGAFTTAVIRTSSSPVCLRNEGEFVVTEELEITLPGADRHIAQRKSQAKYKLEKVTLGDNGKAGAFYFANRGDWYTDKNVYVGAGGLGFAEGAQPNTAYAFGRRNNDHIHIYPWHSDYTIGAKGGTTRDVIVIKSTYFHTDDENGVPRTVTLNGIADVRAALTVKGSGRFQVNSDGMNNGATGSITVTDSATLAYASGADLGAGAVTVGVNTTMEVASGVHTFGGGLTLNDGATLAFNFTEHAVTPQIAVAADKTTTVKGTVKVKIAEGSLRATGGEKILTTCGGFTAEKVSLVAGAPDWVRGLSVNTDGNIVLDVKPMGTVITIR